MRWTRKVVLEYEIEQMKTIQKCSHSLPNSDIFSHFLFWVCLPASSPSPFVFCSWSCSLQQLLLCMNGKMTVQTIACDRTLFCGGMDDVWRLRCWKVLVKWRHCQIGTLMCPDVFKRVAVTWALNYNSKKDCKADQGKERLGCLKCFY